MCACRAGGLAGAVGNFEGLGRMRAPSRRIYRRFIENKPVSRTFGYGMAVGSRFVGTPKIGFGTSETGRDYRLGYSLGRLGGEGPASGWAWMANARSMRTSIARITPTSPASPRAGREPVA